MKILLTGATGFLGSHIAESLVKGNYEIRCLIRSSSNINFLSQFPQIEFVRGQLTDSRALEKALSGVDVVIHNAAITSALRIQDFYTVNVEATQSLLLAIKTHCPHLKKFIYVSSLAAVGPSEANLPHRDTTLSLNPVSHYGRSKALAEEKIQEFKNEFPITIIRPPAIYGPRDKNMFQFFKALHKGIAFRLMGGKTHLSLVHAQDAASAIVKSIAYDAANGNIYYLDDGKIYSYHDFVTQLASAVSKTHYRQIPVSLFAMKMLAFVSEKYALLTQKPALLTMDKLQEVKQLNWTCSSEKTRRDLDWQPSFNWSTGARMTYEWYKEACWL